MSALKSQNELTAMNVVNVLAAVFLFVSPWLFGFAGNQSAAWNAWVSGLVIAGLALAAVVDLQEWEEWVNVALGVWVAAAPWLLGFAGLAEAMWTHVAVGVAVAVLAAVELWMIHNSPRVAA